MYQAAVMLLNIVASHSCTAYQYWAMAPSRWNFFSWR